MLETTPVYAKPIGIVGPALAARAVIQDMLLEVDNVMEISNTISIDDLKSFRLFLQTRAMSRNVGVINLLNKFSDTKQAVLLKIFEQLPEFNVVFFTASFVPNMIIASRSQIRYIKQERTHAAIQNVMGKVLSAMRSKTLSSAMMDSYNIVVQACSWFQDGVINEKELDVILKGLDL